MRRTRIGMIAAAVAVASAAAAPALAARHEAHHHAGAAAAPAMQALGGAGAWAAFATSGATGRVCYLAGQPHKSEAAAGIRRHRPMAMVTHRPAENIANVVSIVEGYPLKPGSDVTLDIDGRHFALFTKDDSAWARTSELDRTIVAAFARGRQAIVRGIPSKGPPTTDVYSLAGFTRTLLLIDKACGIKRAGIAPPPAHHHPHRQRHRHHRTRRHSHH